jgi:hypothetical protein
MSDGGQKTQTTTSSSEPWSGAKPYLTDVMSQAKGLNTAGTGFNPYPGSTVVPFAGQTTQALGNIENIAQGPDNVGLGAIGSEIGKTAQGDYLGGRNPYFEANLNKQSGELANDVQRNVDMLGRRASGYNVNEVAGAVGDFRNKALQDNYNSERGYQMQAASMAPGMYQAQYAPSERLASVGAQNEDLAARQMQDQIRLFEGTQQAPWTRLSNYAGLTSGSGALGGTTSTTAPKPPNYAAPLGGAVAGAQLGSAFGPWGTGLGALGGGALGLLGLM